MSKKITIDWKTSKKGDKYYYLTIEGYHRYPITDVDVEKDGSFLIFFPCLYILKADFEEMYGKDSEGMRDIIECGADYGRVELVEDKEVWDRLYGSRRLLDKTTHERVDGEMVLKWNKYKSEACLSYCCDK